MYGVGGEGMGHATRSAAVIEYLLKKKHTVHICAGGRAFAYLKKRFPNVHKIDEIPLRYKNDTIDYVATAVYMAQHLLFSLIKMIQLLNKLYIDVNPDVVISDYEVFTALTSKIKGVPLIAANNISLIAQTKVDKLPWHIEQHKFWPLFVEWIVAVYANHHVIPAFHAVKKKKKNVTITSPVIRKNVRDLLGKKEIHHVLVYQTSPTHTKILETLRNVDEQFIVYGYGKRKQTKNMTFHAFNEKQFFEHLASAKAVVLGGGFSFISEAIYLKKPILSVPLKNHYEQCINAHYVQKQGFGKYYVSPTANEVRQFMKLLPTYKKKLASYDFNPLDFAVTVERVMRKIGKRHQRVSHESYMELQ